MIAIHHIRTIEVTSASGNWLDLQFTDGPRRTEVLNVTLYFPHTEDKTLVLKNFIAQLQRIVDNATATTPEVVA